MAVVEICCGSYYDAMQAYLGGAKRVELNSALYLGGLTPSVGSLRLVKENCPGLEVCCMVRTRGAGFFYLEEDYQEMLLDAKLLLENGSDGIVFGFLKEDSTIDVERSQEMVQLIHSYHKTAIFHRAFDCVDDPYKAIEELIKLGVDRVLTSGLESKAMEGKEVIKQLQHRYGNQIEILAGSGINDANAKELIEYTGIHQVHSSCKSYKEDSTTSSNHVSYSYGYDDQYDVVSKELVEALIAAI